MNVGVQIRAIGKSKERIMEILKEAICEIENGTTSMYIPLNDKDNTQCDISLCVIKEDNLYLYGNWDNALTLTHEEWGNL